jgi:hypothetical protein
MPKKITVEFILADEEFEEFGKDFVRAENVSRNEGNKRDENNEVHMAASIIQFLCYDDGEMDGTFVVTKVEPTADDAVTQAIVATGNTTITLTQDQYRVLQTVNALYLANVMGNGELPDKDDDTLAELVSLIGIPKGSV